jgi:SDR family mycofactocin-dependent oxidoreductase
MRGRLEGKVAFITGIARGQGRAHAIRLASEGADIVGVDIAGPLPGVPYDSPTPDDLFETAHLVEKEGRRVIAEQCDVRDLEGLKDVADRGVAEFGGLDVVVANAGICIPQLWDGVTPEMFKDTLDINVTGVWNTVMATAHHVIDRKGGSIIITSSYAGRKVQPWMVHYTTSKHALVGMTRAFAAELGTHGVRVNSIHPGPVNTPMGSGDMQSRMAEVAAGAPGLAPMGGVFLPRFSAEASEIADLVAFLASDESSFITSEQISVDGGMQHF